jgi:hypothetical protein
MLDTVATIQAGDIFFYVDNYRRLIRKSIGEINREKELYEEKFWQSEFVGSRYYAGLRAFEHAINYVLKREDPGMVLFGEEGEEETSKEQQDELFEAACRKVRDEKQAEVDDLKRQLQQASDKEQGMQGELVQREQQIRTLARRMESAQSTYVVLIGAMGLIIAVLLGIQLLF